MSQPLIIGRIEPISILDLELYELDAKIDTGAYSNSLHCDDITIENGFVSFRLLDKVHPSYHNKKIKMPLLSGIFYRRNLIFILKYSYQKILNTVQLSAQTYLPKHHLQLCGHKHEINTFYGELR